MSDGTDRTDEYLELIAEDERREAAERNGQTDHIPLPNEPLEDDPYRDTAHEARDDRRADDDKPIWTFIDGATFILDQPDTIPALWGDGTEVLWAEGESLMIAGPMGLGKTTLAVLLMRAQLGLGDGTVLGLPVAERDGKILYLGDGPARTDRARHAPTVHRSTTAPCSPNGCSVWRGPPPADIARNPACWPGSPKPPTPTPSTSTRSKTPPSACPTTKSAPDTTAPANIYSPTVCSSAEQHHTVKRNAGGGPPTAVADIYGSAWITNGTGSIVMLSGEPGDPIVGLRHVRAPADQVGPFQLLHDPDAGTLTIFHSTDLVELVAAAGFVGLTAKGAAAAMFDVVEPRQRPGRESAAAADETHRGRTAHIRRGRTRSRRASPAPGFRAARTDAE